MHKTLIVCCALCLVFAATATAIDRDARLLPRPSDHTFIIAEFDL